MEMSVKMNIVNLISIGRKGFGSQEHNFVKTREVIELVKLLVKGVHKTNLYRNCIIL